MSGTFQVQEFEMIPKYLSDLDSFYSTTTKIEEVTSNLYSLTKTLLTSYSYSIVTAPQKSMV